VKHFNNPLEIIKDFYEIRIGFYQKRKDHLVGVLEFELKKLENELKFIQEVVNGTIIIFKRDFNNLIIEMKKKS
jgi:DNA topoisomerase II